MYQEMEKLLVPTRMSRQGNFYNQDNLLGSDYALYEGESEWKTLGDLLGVTQQTIHQINFTKPWSIFAAQSKKSSKKENRGKKEYESQMNRGKVLLSYRSKDSFRILSTSLFLL